MKPDILRHGTPVEDHRKELGLWVKREDLSCPPPGPPFSKTRGVLAHMAKLEPGITVGVLDTFHSQAGHAVAHAARVLGMNVINYYPEYKNDPGHREPQNRSAYLGAELVGLQAGRSAVLFHQAKKDLAARTGGKGYMMPNALKLPEMVEETAAEVQTLPGEHCAPERVIISISSGTIAAGVLLGWFQGGMAGPMEFILHMGYSRSKEAVLKYIAGKMGPEAAEVMMPLVTLVDEGYEYKRSVKPYQGLPFPANGHYDMKAMNWWLTSRGSLTQKRTLFWLIG
jgi:1-aminocyclopropane-1-carboxylate deaminase/D-cysteine desulfhydrase-like pyridoxal-dependent ACC family enzyme